MRCAAVLVIAVVLATSHTLALLATSRQPVRGSDIVGNVLYVGMPFVASLYLVLLAPLSAWLLARRLVFLRVHALALLVLLSLSTGVISPWIAESAVDAALGRSSTAAVDMSIRTLLLLAVGAIVVIGERRQSEKQQP